MPANYVVRALFLALLVVAAGSATHPPAAGAQTADPPLTGDYSLLAAAPELSFGGVGFAGSLTDAYQAYTRLAAAPLGTVELAWIAQHGTPAARIYAALLLWQQDEAAGRSALTAMLAETVAVQRFEGCLMYQEPLGQVAAQYLAAGPPTIYR